MVTVLGAMKDVIGSEEARGVFRWLAARFSNLTAYRFEVVAAGTLLGVLLSVLGMAVIAAFMPSSWVPNPG